MFGRATIRLGIGPHSSLYVYDIVRTAGSDVVAAVIVRSIKLCRGRHISDSTFQKLVD